MTLLRTITPGEVRLSRLDPVDPQTVARASEIVADVARGGDAAVRRHAESLGDLAPGGPLVIERAQLRKDLDLLDRASRGVLERAAERIARFAEAQRACLLPLDVAVPGGRAGHEFAPVECAGCYAPGGRFPLPSSVLMTAVTARAAGVPTVWVASPRPALVTRAAAAIAGADALLAVGGAQAIGALAHGTERVPACDVVVGPGNRWVTAAKQVVSGRTGIDMLAGPSEVLVIADATARAGVIAADLLAQAEHDPDAVVWLVTDDAGLIARVNEELASQLVDLPTAETARAALARGAAVLVKGMGDAAAVADEIAPEHLEVMTADAPKIAARLKHFGSLFIGERAAEVFGDYGAGPNHVLPTGGTARSQGGLSVLAFLRMRTWLRLDDCRELAPDAAALARLEGLEAHARAAERRQS